MFKKMSQVVGDDDSIAGYLPDGNPLTKIDLIARAKKSEEDIAAGRFVCQEDLEKETDNRWK